MLLVKLANLCFIIALLILVIDNNYNKITLSTRIIVMLLSIIGLILQVINLIKDWFM